MPSAVTARAVRRIRVLHLVSHPVPYFIPLYQNLAARPHLDLTVWYLSTAGLRPVLERSFKTELAWDIPLTAGYRSRFLSMDARIPAPPKEALRRLWKIMRGVQPRTFDALWIHGYSSMASMVALAASQVRGIPALIRDDATLLDQRPLFRRVLKRLIVPLVLRNVYGLYVGFQNRWFFASHGVAETRLLPAPYSVNNEFFQTEAKRLRRDRHGLRDELGLRRDVPVVLFCGKLVDRKNPVALLKAFAILRREADCALLFAGDGPLRQTLQAAVRRQRIPDVRFSGFLNQSKIGRAYAAADVIVLPSTERETWGLVINEAMNFALPAIVSDKVGCANELVRTGENGYVVPAGSDTALLEALRSLVLDDSKRAAYGARSRTVINEWTVDRTADALDHAFQVAIKR